MAGLAIMPGVTLDQRVRELLEKGDRAGAASEALQELGPLTLRYLRSLLQDEDDAADAFSQFAENLWKGLPSFRFSASLRTWAYRIAWNAARNLRHEAYRRHGRRFASGEASAIADEIRTKTTERIARQKDALEQLRRSLSVEDQSLLALRIDQGLSWAEVAEVLAEEGRAVQSAALMKRFERLKTRLAELARAQGLAG
jgi:RNA polymerase sigma-70 factor (ECF subfamily)